MPETPSAGALAGFKVIDLSRVLAGPYCTQILADHGAEVIKVEPPQGDDTRDWGPPYNEEGLSAYYSGVNRNKRAVALDLGKPEGKAVLLRLLEGADVLIENFKAGSMRKWGLGYEEALRDRFPRLIYCSITGFGEHGPMGGFPGYDAAVQAFSGLVSINGSPESGQMRLGIPLVDIGTGLYSAIGILLAAQARQRTGRGQRVDATLFDTGVALLHPHAANYFMSGKAPKLTGNHHPNVAPYSLYKTKKGDVFLAIGNDRQFRLLCEVVNRPDLARDERFRTNGDRLKNREAMEEALVAAFANYTAEEISAALLKAGAPAGAALTVPEVMEHPHTAARQMTVRIDGYRGAGIPLKLSHTPGSARTKPPVFGAETRRVLKEHGLADAEIDRLIAERVAFTERQKGPA
jgi:crotonobetainyl-CoA:carnitine CoA-transferase CaiB-like acyl-CoA transferase